MSTMQVETYEVEPLNGSEIQTLAAEGEALELIESLGLEGQKELTSEASGTVIPYRQLEKKEHFTFKALFPNRCKIEQYKAGPIPLRVLQVASYVRTLNEPSLDYLEVWFPEVGIDDPVLVARKDAYSDPVYLLARWGKALRPFNDLYEEAKKTVSAELVAKVKKMQKQINDVAADPLAYYADDLARGIIPTPYFCL